MKLTKIKGVKNKSEEVEIEIELELESGLIVDFTPDFRVQQNTSDHSAVQWRLPCTGTPVNMVFLYDEFQEEESVYSTIFSGSDV